MVNLNNRSVVAQCGDSRLQFAVFQILPSPHSSAIQFNLIPVIPVVMRWSSHRSPAQPYTPYW